MNSTLLFGHAAFLYWFIVGFSIIPYFFLTFEYKVAPYTLEWS
ncbi:hypothetical protein ABIA71_003641 [Stenotrophomonas sp. 2619]